MRQLHPRRNGCPKMLSFSYLDATQAYFYNWPKVIVKLGTLHVAGRRAGRCRRWVVYQYLQLPSMVQPVPPPPRSYVAKYVPKYVATYLATMGPKNWNPSHHLGLINYSLLRIID